MNYPKTGERASHLVPPRFSAILEVLTNEQGKKKIKFMHIGMKKVKLPLFADDIFIYVRNLIEFTRKLIGAMNE